MPPFLPWSMKVHSLQIVVLILLVQLSIIFPSIQLQPQQQPLQVVPSSPTPPSFLLPPHTFLPQVSPPRASEVTNFITSILHLFAVNVLYPYRQELHMYLCSGSEMRFHVNSFVFRRAWIFSHINTIHQLMHVMKKKDIFQWTATLFDRQLHHTTIHYLEFSIGNF